MQKFSPKNIYLEIELKFGGVQKFPLTQLSSKKLIIQDRTTYLDLFDTLSKWIIEDTQANQTKKVNIITPRTSSELKVSDSKIVMTNTSSSNLPGKKKLTVETGFVNEPRVKMPWELKDQSSTQSVLFNPDIFG